MTTPQSARSSKADGILRALRAAIANGDYPVESQLPTEAELCERFSASRTSVRKALAHLVADGLVESRRGSGSYVRPTHADRPISQTISVMFPFDANSLASVQGRALALGHLICVHTHADWSPATERRFLERVLDERHRALLAFCTPLAPRNDDLLQELSNRGTRVIHVEYYRESEPDQAFILPDYRRAGALAATTMLLAGYEHFASVSLTGDGPYAQIIRQGFREALEDHRVPAERILHLEMPPGFDHLPQFREETRRRLGGLPANIGLIARSENTGELLVGAMRALGRSVPEDVGVVGVQHLLADRPTTGVDRIAFDWNALLEKSLVAACDPRWGSPREWIRPQLQPTGSMRPARGAST